MEALARALEGNLSIKLGKLRYAIGVYEKLVRATVAISSANHGFYLLLPFDKGCDASGIIERKVFPHIKR